MDQAITQSRTFSKSLIPVELEEDGLVMALREFSTNSEQLFGISCILSASENISVKDNEVATHISTTSKYAGVGTRVQNLST